jgi:hypothetical protein
MKPEQQDNSLETLQHIRGIMDRSSRFLSLSGWSGVWAGSTALVGAFIASKWVPYISVAHHLPGALFEPETIKMFVLAACIFIVALCGGLFFTWRKVKNQGLTLWNHASKQFVFQVMLPLITGGIFCIGFLYYGAIMFIAPACLVFYGLALINGSKYTLSDIRWLGIFEVLLGCINLFWPSYSLYFWAAGFGVLHILYGIIMWNKYDKQSNN